MNLISVVKELLCIERFAVPSRVWVLLTELTGESEKRGVAVAEVAGKKRNCRSK